MKISRKLRVVLIAVAFLLIGLTAICFLPSENDSAKVHPIVRGVHEPVKQLVLTPFPNGFLIEVVGADDQNVSALLEYWNTGTNGESGNWHKLKIRSDPHGASEPVDAAYSDTSLALAKLVDQYAKPGKKRDDALFYLTGGKKYRVIGAFRAAKRKMSGG